LRNYLAQPVHNIVRLGRFNVTQGITLLLGLKSDMDMPQSQDVGTSWKRRDVHDLFARDHRRAKKDPPVPGGSNYLLIQLTAVRGS
jgi:hypothetical protein